MIKQKAKKESRKNRLIEQTNKMIHPKKTKDLKRRSVLPQSVISTLCS